MPPLLVVRDLYVHYPTAAGIARAVDGISFRVDAGRTLGLVGESGCGKSSVALAIPRLHNDGARVRGSVVFAGTPLQELSEAQMRTVRGNGIAVLFQDAAGSFDPLLSVGSQISEIIKLHQRLSRRSARVAALDLLRAVRLQDAERVASQYPHELSGGMAQRAALAVALAGQPRLLIADEPTSALDVTVQAEILELVKDPRSVRQMAILWISHGLDVVAELADDVAVMYAGKIVEAGPAAAIFDTPRHPYTQALLRCRPRLGQTGRLPTIEGTVPPPTRLPEGCRFRERCPHRTEICLQDPVCEELPGGHTVACWNWRQVNPEGRP